MLRMIKVSKRFNGVPVLNSLSCHVHEGDFVVIMGPNGTGKSTLFDVIGGKTCPDAGTVSVDGVNITRWSERQRVSLIGRLFQNTSLGSCASLTIRENIALASLKKRPARLKNGFAAFPEEVVEQLLQPLHLNLDKLLDVPMGALSGGQRQIVAFIMTTLTPPKLLLLDEPTAALDPRSSKLLLAFAESYSKKHGVPTLLITHDPQVATRLGNRLWILQEGSVAREYGPEKSEIDPATLLHGAFA